MILTEVQVGLGLLPVALGDPDNELSGLLLQGDLRSEIARCH